MHNARMVLLDLADFLVNFFLPLWKQSYVEGFNAAIHFILLTSVNHGFCRPETQPESLSEMIPGYIQLVRADRKSLLGDFGFRLHRGLIRDVPEDYGTSSV